MDFKAPSFIGNQHQRIRCFWNNGKATVLLTYCLLMIIIRTSSLSWLVFHIFA